VVEDRRGGKKENDYRRGDQRHRERRGLRRRGAEDGGWYTRERIAREYRLVKGFAGKRGNGELNGGEGGVNGAAGKMKRRMSHALPKAKAQSVGHLRDAAPRKS
jgi:hypothetical protein